jgi:hypothetical protein
MTAKMADVWKQHDRPANTLAGVAEIIAGVAAQRGLNWKAMCVEGGGGWEVEEGIDRCAGMWMRERQDREFHRGDEVMEMVRFSRSFDE